MADIPDLSAARALAERLEAATVADDLKAAAATIRALVETLEGGADQPAPDPDVPSPAQPVVPFSLDDVVWLHTDVSRWQQTSTLTKVRITGEKICLEHTKVGKWPVGGRDEPVEGNPWVFAQVDGRWHAATYEWLRPGQVCKNITAANIGAHIKKEPLKSWVPQPGELVGFMVSALARMGRETVEERSDIVMVRWP